MNQVDCLVFFQVFLVFISVCLSDYKLFVSSKPKIPRLGKWRAMLLVGLGEPMFIFKGCDFHTLRMQLPPDKMVGTGLGDFASWTLASSESSLS